MRDYLDSLIERHTDGAPEIKPRLPSMFESEVSHGGWDVAVRDDRAIEMDETHPSALSMRIAERIPPHSDTTTRAVADAAPGPTMPATQGSPSIKTGLNEPVCSLPPRETPTLPSPSQGEGEEGVRALNEGFPTSSAATLVAPVMGRVRHAHQDAHQETRTEHTSPNPQITTQRQPLVKEGLKELVFSFPPRETPTLSPPSESEEWVRRPNQGLLKPSATSISPGYPSVARTEDPASRPEPVIHVSIGRIEVRATTSPQKQAPRPEIRSPVMGLEEYLHRRSGGQDR